MTDDFEFKVIKKYNTDVIELYFKNIRLGCSFTVKGLHDVQQLNIDVDKSLFDMILFHVLSLYYNEYKSIDNLKSFYDEELKIKFNDLVERTK